MVGTDRRRDTGKGRRAGEKREEERRRRRKKNLLPSFNVFPAYTYHACILLPWRKREGNPCILPVLHQTSPFPSLPQAVLPSTRTHGPVLWTFPILNSVPSWLCF